MIADQIREASTAQDVFTLLGAYVETIGGSEKARYLPEGMATLPDSVDELMQRCLQLMGGLDAASRGLDDRACVVIREALHVFSSALNHVKMLERERHRALVGCFPARGMSNATRGVPAAVSRAGLY